LGTSKSFKDQNTFTLTLAGIFLVLFILSTLAFLFSYFPTRQILNPDFYKQVLEDVQVYQNLPRVIAGRLASSITQDEGGSNLTDDSPPNLVILSQEEWESILIDLLDPRWLQSQSESVIDQFFEILLVSPDPVNTPIEISLEEVKSRLAGPEGRQAFKQILDAQPPCSVNQLLGLLQLGLGLPAHIDTLLCRPPEYIISELSAAVDWLLSIAVDQVPDQVHVSIPERLLDTSAPESSIEQNQQLVPEIIQDIRRVDTAISWSPLLPLVLLSLMTFFAVRSLNDLLIWWGGALFSTGLISLIFTLSLFPATSWAFNRLMPTSSETYFGLADILIQLGITEFSREVASRLVMSIVLPAVVITVIGLSLLLASYFLARKTQTADEEKIIPQQSAPVELKDD
jgi:hypothetical protein